MSYNTDLQENNAALEEILETVNNLPDSGGNVDLGVTGATVGQTVKISAVDENGVPTAWEPTDFPSGGGATEEVWEDVCDVTIGADVRTQHILTTAEGKKYKKIYVAFSGVGTNALICCQRDQVFPDTYSSVTSAIAYSVKLFSAGVYTGVLLDKDEFGRFKTSHRYSGVGPDSDTTSIKVQPIISRAGSALDKEYINALTLYSINTNALTAGGKLTIKGVRY